MSGHSKWKTIKHKKAAADAKRGKAFTKLIKEITVCAKQSGGDPDANPRLRTLLEKAKEVNMPIENAQRAIKKGTGELPGQSYESQTYEGYAPCGVAVMVETLSDNKNRTVAELRHAFSKHGGSLGENGSVAWMFKHMGVVRCDATNATEDDFLEMLLDFNIESISIQDNEAEIVVDPKQLEMVRKAVANTGRKVTEAQLEWVATTKTELTEQQAEQVLEFLDAIEELDDVQDVYTTME